MVTTQKKYTKYRDVKLKLNPVAWSNFVTPYGINVIWDDYNFAEQTIVGRFYVSEAHANPKGRKTEQDIDRWLETMDRYVITTNAVHSKIREIENSGVQWGQRTTTMLDHPYTKQVPKDIDIHASMKERDYSKLMSKEELTEINHTIIDNASKFREWKPFRDERYKPKEVYDNNGKVKYEVFVGVLEEIS